MKNIIFIIIVLISVNISFGQNSVPKQLDSLYNFYSERLVDSVSQELKNYSGSNDTTRQHIIFNLWLKIMLSRPVKAFYASQEGLRLSRVIQNPHGEDISKISIGLALWVMGDYAETTKIAFENIKLSESLRDDFTIGWDNQLLILGFRDQGNFSQALKYCRKDDYGDLGAIYVGMNKPDSALLYLQKAGSHQAGRSPWVFMLFANAYSLIGNNQLALELYKKSIKGNKETDDLKDLSDAYIGLAKLFEKEGKMDSCIYYANKGFQISQSAPFNKAVFQTSLLLSRIYEKIDASESLLYLKLAMAAKDSIINLQKISQSYSSEFSEEMRQKEYEAEKTKYQNKVRTFGFLSALIVFAIITFILLSNNRQRRRAFALLQKQNQEIDNQKQKVESTLDDLKSTQSQLIQSEKMASLGEMTAGIAHEIQNPLNFMNNFSEVNKELIQEMQDELKTGNNKEAIAISNNIKENEDKISNHGKRADAIVKGMLQHSRISPGIKEPTNINALADEYLRLAYHGIRAKDKDFNCTIKTDFDARIGVINIIPQDIGRVLLNLYNNAFYVLDEKGRQLPVGYEPVVSVSTKKMDKNVEIRVKDNGNGVPQKILDKIFQPFFTTKPAGQGTGLGLSLSYDIVKAHGGEINVETKEGGYTEFIVILPS